MDGLILNTGEVVAEGCEVEVLIASEEYLAEVSKVMTRPKGVAVFKMQNGKLQFVRETPNEIIHY